MQNVLFLVISGFAKIFWISFVVWMVALIGLMFKEMFSSEELTLRVYLLKVMRILSLSFELVAYGAVLVFLIMMFVTRNYMDYGINVGVALLLSGIYLSIRKRTVGFRLKKVGKAVGRE